MATALTHTPAGTHGGTDDPFHDPILFGIGIVSVIVTLVILALTGLVIWGVQYGVPPWNAYSYPPPIVH